MPTPPKETGGSGKKHSTARIGSLGRSALREVIESTWDSIANYDPLAAKPFSLAVYDRNEESQQSTWAGIDLDWHDREQPGPPQRHAMRKL